MNCYWGLGVLVGGYLAAHHAVMKSKNNPKTI
jgi:hypothetical protein